MGELDVNIDISEKYVLPKVLVCANTIELGTSISEFVRKYKKGEELVVKQEDSFLILRKKDLTYASVNQKMLTLYTIEQKVEVKKSLKELMEELDADIFYPISKSAIVNIKKIKRLEVAFSGNYYAYLTNGMKVVISRRFIEKLKNRFGI